MEAIATSPEPFGREPNGALLALATNGAGDSGAPKCRAFTVHFALQGEIKVRMGRHEDRRPVLHCRVCLVFAYSRSGDGFPPPKMGGSSSGRPVFGTRVHSSGFGSPLGVVPDPLNSALGVRGFFPVGVSRCQEAEAWMKRARAEGARKKGRTFGTTKWPARIRNTVLCVVLRKQGVLRFWGCAI